MKICPNCGIENPDGVSVCNNCYAVLSSNSESQSLNEEQTRIVQKKPIQSNHEESTTSQARRSSSIQIEPQIIALVVVIVLAASAISFGLGRIGYVSKEEYEEVSSGIAQLTARNRELMNKVNEYEAIIQPYKDLSAAQIAEQTAAANLKAKQDEEALAAKQAAEAAEAQAAEEKAAAEQAAAEKAAAEAAAAEKARGYDTGITYEQLARTPDSYIGQKVKFTGEVVQVMEGSSETQIRLAVNGDYDTIVLCGVPKSLTSSTRILEDDKILIMGTSVGLISYQSTLGGTITIPGIVVDDWGPNY